MKNFTFSIRNLIIAFFGFIIIISVVNILTIKYYQSKQEKDSALVDVSGRNRMLSQKIGFYAEMVIHGNLDARKELATTIMLHDSSLQVLRSGGIAPGIANGFVLPEADPEIIPAIKKAEQLWFKFKSSAEIVLSATIDSEQGATAEGVKAMKFLEGNAKKMLSINNQLVQAYVALNRAKKAKLDMVMLVIMLINISVMIAAFILARRHILTPIRKIAETSKKIANGDLAKEFINHADPYVDMLVSSINQLSSNLDKSAQFAENIGNGKFDYELSQNDENNTLFNQLTNMRDKLMLVAEEDKKRNWATDGLAVFSDVIRTHQGNMDKLCYEIISKLVKYLKVNQGGIFLINDQDSDDVYLELKACYAWERKKHLHKKIMSGEGLVGQCWLEKDIIYMTDVPSNYVNITSGLGAAIPKSILIVPLIFNEEILGVLEIAGFNVLQDHEIEFVKKVSENIATSLSSAQINAKTRLLLQESQEQGEQMSAQEEEIRQHMEEMQATQEEMERTRTEINGTMNAIGSTSAVIQFDASGIILTANELFLSTMNYNDVEEIRGKHHRIFVESSYARSEEYEKFWQDLKAGKSFSGEFARKTKDGSDVWLLANYTPVLDDAGNVLKIIKLASDNTQEKLRNNYLESQIDAIHLSHSMVEFDMNGMVTNANDIFLDIMGYNRTEIISKHHSIFCHKEYIECEEYRQLWEKLEQGKYSKGKFQRFTKNGDEVWFEATYTPILDLNGKPIKVIKLANKIQKGNTEKALYISA